MSMISKTITPTSNSSSSATTPSSLPSPSLSYTSTGHNHQIVYDTGVILPVCTLTIEQFIAQSYFINKNGSCIICFNFVTRHRTSKPICGKSQDELLRNNLLTSKEYCKECFNKGVLCEKFNHKSGSIFEIDTPSEETKTDTSLLYPFSIAKPYLKNSDNFALNLDGLFNKDFKKDFFLFNIINFSDIYQSQIALNNLFYILESNTLFLEPSPLRLSYFVSSILSIVCRLFNEPNPISPAILSSPSKEVLPLDKNTSEEYVTVETESDNLNTDTEGGDATSLSSTNNTNQCKTIIELSKQFKVKKFPIEGVFNFIVVIKNIRICVVVTKPLALEEGMIQCFSAIESLSNEGPVYGIVTDYSTWIISESDKSGNKYFKQFLNFENIDKLPLKDSLQDLITILYSLFSHVSKIATQD